MLVIGLTGGIASGKSTALALFADLGIAVTSADDIARQILQPGETAYAKVIAKLGTDYLHSDGHINRDKLRQWVFADTKNRQWLESITHPFIRQQMHQFVAQQNGPYCVIEIPLLLEATANNPLINRILVIDVPEEKRITRLVARNQFSPEQIKGILQAQVSDEVRRQRADDIIDNQVSIEQLQQKITQLHQFYLDLSQSKV